MIRHKFRWWMADDWTLGLFAALSIALGIALIAFGYADRLLGLISWIF